MSALHRHVALLAAALVGMASPFAVAGLAEGLDALKRGDYATAAKELRPLAERGDAEAQHRVGLMYEFGKGFAADKPQSMAWLGKAAAQGHPGAQLELGVIYATGDGMPEEPVKAVEWFRKAATQGNATAQYNLGLMYAKGSGVRKDDAEGIAWFRKAARQGDAGALFKLGVAYENGEGVAKDHVLSYVHCAIAARTGNKEYAEYRDDGAKRLDAAQLKDARAVAADWQVGRALPARAAVGAASGGTTAAPSPDKCSASGVMEGRRFTATNCAVALYADQHSVAIWFSEEPIAPAEKESYELSACAEGAKGGRQRTMVQVMFCPGGGAATASPASVRSLDLNTNHSASPLAGVQWVVEAPRDFKAERMAGEIKPGGRLTGRFIGARAATTFNLDFDVTLPAKDAAAAMTCAK